MSSQETHLQNCRQCKSQSEENKFTRHNSLSLQSAHINPCLYLALNMCSSDVYNFINLHVRLYISSPQHQTSAGTIPVWAYLNYSKDSGICFLFFSHFKTLDMENVYHKINIYINGFSPYRTSQVNHLKFKIYSLISILFSMLRMLNLHFIIIHKHYFSQFTEVIILLILYSGGCLLN